jgi:hypothetical protein
MAIDTSISPYFDDYIEDKNFYKVLYKPGVAIQSRELNQSQTIFQNQIKRIGDYLYTDGQKVTGPKPSVNLDARTVRIKDKDITGATLNLSLFKDKYVTSENTSIVGLVEFVFEKNDPDIGDLPSIVISLKRFNSSDKGLFPEKDTLYFYDSYSDALNNSGTSLTAVVESNIIKNAMSTTTSFSKVIILSSPTTLIEVGDLVVHPSILKDVYVTSVISSVQIEVDVAPGIDIGNENIQFTKQASCPTVIVIQDICYFYKNGYLVRTGLQKIVPDKNSGSPSKAIGLFVTESVVSSADDASLLDPAIGSSNYFAPGADRLKIDLSLASFDLTAESKADTAENIIPLITFNKGQIEYVAEIDSATEIRREMETRTYDESGNYVVKDFIISPISTYDNDPSLRFTVSGGKAYIGGRQVITTSSTDIEIPKPITTDTKTNFNITTTQGNYLRITDVNIQGGNMIIPKPETLTQGEIYLEMHNVANPTAANAANTKVGTLVFKNLEYDSSLGNSVTQLKLFYHNFSLVKEAPATWADWSTKYGISVADGQYIAGIFYSSPAANTLLGNYGVANTPSYALYREPGTDEVAYWYKQWSILDGRDISKTKKKFAEAILSNTGDPDYTRLTSSSKAFYQVVNGSPFSDGLLNVNKVKSIVGVNNFSTSHYTAATYSAPFFYANVSSQGMDSQQNILIVDSRPSDTLIFPVGTKEYLKTLNNIRTTYSRVIRNAIFNAGVYTKTLSYPESFALGDGVIVASTARTNFIVSIKSGATAAVKYGIFNFEQGTVTISGDATIASINLGDPSFTGLADIEFLVESDNLSPRTKTLVSDAGQFINVTTPELDYSLKISDIASFGGIYKLANASAFLGAWQSNLSYDYNNYVLRNGILYTAVLPSSNTSVLNTNVWSRVNTTIDSNFILSNGQKDGWYDHGYIKYIGSTAAIPGNVLVTYDYFTHNGDGPCTVNSYPLDYYSSIDIYKSVVDSKEYNLRDCLDFRPKRINGSDYLNFETAIFPTSYVNTEADVTYYLGRIDKLYISRDAVNFDSPYNRLFVETGVEQNNPDSKNEAEDKSKLAIATIIIPPYTTSSFDVDIEYEDNKRFTMKDIAKLEKTTIALDKAIRIQSVEIANLKSQVINDNGDTLLKSGILVENFSDFSKADIQNPNFNIAISTTENSCYALYAAYQIDLQLTAASNYNLFSDLITAKYEEEIFISQTEANGFINPNPGGIDDRRGKAIISKRNSYKLNLWQLGLQLAGIAVAGLTVFNYFAGIAGVQGILLASAKAALVSVGGAIATAVGYVGGAISGVIIGASNAVAGWIGASSITTLGAAIPYVAVAIAVYYIVDAIAPGVTKFIKGVAGAAVDVVKKGASFISNTVKSVGNTIKKWFSDVNMKENIVFLEKLHSGINIYKFEYKKQFKDLPMAGNGVFYGVLAHEVEKVYPHAISTIGGYKVVDYSLIGINRN